MWIGTGFIFLSLGMGSVSKPKVFDLKKTWIQGYVCGPRVGGEKSWRLELCLTHIYKDSRWQKKSETIKTTFYTYLAPDNTDQIRAFIKFKKHTRSNSYVGKVSGDDAWTFLEPKSLKQSPPTQSELQIKRSLGTRTFQMYQAIVLGESAYLSDPIKDVFIRLGIIHLFVFSGFHVGVVFGLFYVVLLLCLLGQKNMVVKKATCLIGAWIATTVFLGCFISFNMPSFRAWLFLGVYVSVQVCLLPKHLLKTILITLFFVLLLAPEETFSLSAYLSFLAVVGIVWSLQLTQIGSQKGVARWLKNNFVISMGAYLWTTPILIYYFSQWHVLTYINNFLLVPTFGILMIALSLLLKLVSMSGVVFLMQAVSILLNQVACLFLKVVDVFLYMQPDPLAVRFSKTLTVLIYACLIAAYLFFQIRARRPGSDFKGAFWAKKFRPRSNDVQSFFP